MATITVNPTYLDGGTARTAGEVMTINGGRLVVRTDTRWHANAPASMTGALGSPTISAALGGGYELDGTKVRWLAYTGGSGTVPAIGTTVSQGGASGYLLGVWATITSAPTAVAAAMPATGFIKFREVTSVFAAGALTGITATAAGADVVGWIEVVHDQAATITVPRLGDFKVRGDWFALGTTTGAANQLVSVPTNGSATAYTPGVWIETATAGVYEFYPALYAAAMATANLGTDARSKFVCMETNGSVRIGHNGTAAVGYVPPAGRKVRIANVLGRQCVTTTRAVNAIPNATIASRPEFATTSAGAIDIENFASDWYHIFAQAYSVRMVHCATFETINISECATALTLQDVGLGHSATQDLRTLSMLSNFAGGLVEDCVFHRFSSGTTDHAVEVLYCVGITLRRVLSGIITFARSTGLPFQLTQSSSLVVDDCTQFNGILGITTCTDVTVTDLDHCDRYMGATTTATGFAVTVTATCKNVLVDRVTFGLKGLIANVHPYSGVFSVMASEDVTFRNLGTSAAFANGGSVNQPAYIVSSSGNNRRIRVQRCYMTPTSSGAINVINSDKACSFDHVYGDYADLLTNAGLNQVVRGCGATNNGTAQVAVYGTHFWHVFTAVDNCLIVLSLNEPTPETAAYVTVVAGTPKFTSAGNIAMVSVGDEVIWEQDYFIKGCTGLVNVAPSLVGTNIVYVSGALWGNHNLYFQIDTGAGFNGTWLDMTGPVLAAQTGITPDVGFKLKFRAVCAVASTTNLLSYIRVSAVSSLADQHNNLYPLDVITTTLSPNVSITGAEVRIYDMDNAPAGSLGSEIAGTESAGASFSFATGASNTVWIQIIQTGFKEFGYQYTTGSTDATLPVTLVAETNT